MARKNPRSRESDKPFSLLRGLNNDKVAECLNSDHICAVWLTSEIFVDSSGFRVWKDIGDDEEIPYLADMIMKRFRGQISKETSEEDLIKLSDKVPVILVKLGYDGKINDNVVIAVPYGFRFGVYKGERHLYFKRGKILCEIPKEDIPEWMMRYENKTFGAFASFFREEK